MPDPTPDPRLTKTLLPIALVEAALLAGWIAAALTFWPDDTMVLVAGCVGITSFTSVLLFAAIVAARREDPP